MRKFTRGHRADSTVAGLFAAAILLTTGDSSPAAGQTEDVDVPTAEIPVRNRGRYIMPQGASVTAGDVERKRVALLLREQRRPQPKHAAELERLKNLPAPRGVPTRLAPEAQPGSRDIGDITIRLKACFGGAGDGGDFASNVSGAMGDSGRFVQATSLTTTVIDFGGTCAARTEQPLDHILGATGDEHAFEPHVYYDAATGRWTIAAAGFNFSNGNQSVLLAHSTDGLDWTRLAIPLVEDGTTSCLLDPFNGVFFPKVAVYPTGVPGEPRIVIAAVDEGVTASGIVTTASLDGAKPAACSSTPEPVVPAHWQDDYGLQFALLFGFAPLEDFKAASAGPRKIQRYELTLGSRPSKDRLRRKSPITVPAWKQPPDARQPNGQKLETGDGGFTSPPVQIGDRIWAVHTVDDGGFARPRIYELSTTADMPLAVYQLSSVPEQNDHLFNASIAVNGKGPNGVAFLNVTRTIRDAGKDGRAAMVMMSGPHGSGAGWNSIVVKTSPGQFSTIGGGGNACNNTAQGGCNWGGYSSIQIDPSNKNIAWATNQLATRGTLGGAGSDYNWSTVIGGVRR